MSNEKKNQNQIQIEVPQEEMQGHYANLAVIAHSSNEFVLDFVFLSPGNPKARVQSRVVMTPENAKHLLFALKENMDKYEMNFGEITTKRKRSGDEILDFTQAKGQA